MQSSQVIPRVTDKTGGSLSHPKLPNILLGLIVFTSATQFGLHLWPLSSLVYGIRIDYLSPTLYFLDLLIVLYLLLFGYLKNYLGFRISNLGFIFPILLTNLLFSANPLATLSWSLHFLLYFAFVRTLLNRNSRLQAEKGSVATERRVLVGTLALTLLFQLVLAATQTTLGHSVGGLLYYLGERMVAVGSPGIATATFMGGTVLRGYGTFGHPNVLAGWLVVCLLILIRLRTIVWAPLALTALGVLLTQSRSAALVLFGIVIPLYLFKNLKLRLLYYSITLLFYSSFSSTLLSPSRSNLSRSERQELSTVSHLVIRVFPFFGAGAQASISTYPAVSPNTRLLQPDHNSSTLFLSWFGVFGVLAILYALSHLISNSYFLIPLIPLLLLDHYFLTSPQGLFVILLYLRLVGLQRPSEQITRRQRV